MEEERRWRGEEELESYSKNRKETDMNKGIVITGLVLLALAFMFVGNTAASCYGITVDGDASDWAPRLQFIEDPAQDAFPFKSGYDITGVGFWYNDSADKMYFMINTSGVAGDTDGNGWNHNTSYVFPDYPGISKEASERYSIDLDINNDQIREYRINYTNNTVIAQYENGTTIPDINVEGAFSDNNAVPGIVEMSVTNARSLLITDRLCLQGYAGALDLLVDETVWACINPGIFQPNVTVNVTVKNATSDYVDHVNASQAELVTFKVNVSNTGACRVDVMVYDTLPDTWEWANGAVPVETGKDAGNKRVWWNFSLDTGAYQEIFFNARAIGQVQVYANKLHVTGVNQTSGCGTYDEDTANVYIISAPGLEIEKTVWNAATWVDQLAVNRNDTVRFKLCVHHNGSCCNLSDIRVTDCLPAELTYLGTVTPFEPASDGNEYTWTFSTLNLSEEKTIVFEARVTRHSENIINTVTADGNCSETSTRLTDSDTATLTVNPPPTPTPAPRGGGGRSSFGTTITGNTGTTTLFITSTGNVITTSTAISADGKARVTIPKETTARDSQGKALTAVTITRLSTLPANVPSGVTYVGYAYDFGPLGATFSKPVKSSITFNPADFARSTPIMYTYEAGTWKALKTTIVGNTVTTEINHFSIFVLFAVGTEKPPARALEGASEVTTPTSPLTEEPPAEPVVERSKYMRVLVITAIVTAVVVAPIVYRTQKRSEIEALGRRWNTGLLSEIITGVQRRIDTTTLKRRKTGPLRGRGTRTRVNGRRKIESLGRRKWGIVAAITDKVHGRRVHRRRKVWE